MAFCSNCGSKLEEGVKFCHNCGLAVGGKSIVSVVQNQTQSMSENKSFIKPKKNRVLLAGIIVGILIGVCGIFGNILDTSVRSSFNDEIEQYKIESKLSPEERLKNLMHDSYGYMSTEQKEQAIKDLKLDKTYNPFKAIALLIIMSGLHFTGLVINIISWYKNNEKKALIAGVIYLISVFGIISAILCFIGRIRIKKAMITGK